MRDARLAVPVVRLGSAYGPSEIGLRSCYLERPGTVRPSLASNVAPEDSLTAVVIHITASAVVLPQGTINLQLRCCYRHLFYDVCPLVGSSVAQECHMEHPGKSAFARWFLAFGRSYQACNVQHHGRET